MKFLFGLVLSALTFASAFAGIWDVDTKEEVEKHVARMKANPQWPVPDYQEKCFVALIGKSSENMTYEEFKAVFKNNFDLLKDKIDKSKVDKDYWKVNLAQAALFAKRFSDFATYVLKDEELKNLPYVKRFYPIYKKNLFTDAERLDIFRSFYKASKTSRHYRDHIWAHHKQLIDKMPTEDAIKELKEIKRYTYPLIGKDDQWKKFLIEIELMIKALQ